VNVGSKEQSKQWMHTHSPNKPNTFKETSACQKADGDYFLGQERSANGGIHAERGTMSEVYCETLKKNSVGPYRTKGVDETWVSFVNVITKEQSKQWMHTHSPNKPNTFKETLSACQKADGDYFLGQERSANGGIHAARGTMSEVYCKTLKKNCVGPYRTKGVEC
jgi:DNA-directed RNA polymerase subunit M/transcription elongation factor TFIIS